MDAKEGVISVGRDSADLRFYKQDSCAGPGNRLSDRCQSRVCVCLTIDWLMFFSWEGCCFVFDIAQSWSKRESAECREPCTGSTIVMFMCARLVPAVGVGYREGPILREV